MGKTGGLRVLKDLQAYELLQQQTIDDIHAEGYLLRHKKSGARVVILENDDENKVFNITFRTPPANSTGVPHIIEHTVLCGSREFPLKDPFIELAKGSLNTFLNAMTFSDKTMYPVASCNDQDFKNLMHVYLDAVFYPNIYRNDKVFQQEGWSYHLDSVDGPLTYNGVVYNEMKGATSSVEDIMYQATMKEMFKDTYLRYNSGGNPKYITDLTYEMYKDVYKKHYIPENSLSFFYGDIDIKEKLKFLDKEYFSIYKKQGINIGFFKQKPYVKENIEILYPLSNDEELKDNTYINLCYSLGDYSNSKEILAMDIVLTSLFFIIFAISYDKGVIAFCLFGLASIFSLFNTVFFIYNQGITIRAKDIIIID